MNKQVKGKKQSRGNPLGDRKCQALVGQNNGMVILMRGGF
jgi:hypothetical protein